MRSSKKQFCLRGHDTHISGRDINSRACKVCNRDRPSLRNRMYKLAGILNPDGSQFTTVDFDQAYQVQQGKCSWPIY